MIFETTQYSANPLGYDKVKKPNNSGIITSIIWLCAACCGSVLGRVTIFCCIHMVPATTSDVSVKVTVRGAGPDRGEPKKLAVGIPGPPEFTLIYPALVTVLLPEALVTVSEYEPAWPDAAFVMLGLCRDDVNPLGPVHE